MTPFDDYIAERAALGKLAQNVIVTAPGGEQVLYFVDPTGYEGSPNGIDYLYRAIIFEGEVRLVGYGPGVADGTPLNVVLTPEGPAVEYEFYRDGLIFQSTVLGFSQYGFPEYGSETIEAYTEANPDAGLAVFGDGGRDDLFGTELDDIMRGEAGYDTIDGGAGDDLIYGGRGFDTITGGIGDDEIYGNSGRDRIEGEAGDDYLHGGSNRDKLFGGFGNDTLYGGEHDDYLYGGQGEDFLSGGDGSDKMRGGQGMDEMHGNKGDDEMYGDKSNDILRGDDGDDALFGGRGKDEMFGGAGDDVLSGGVHNDTMYGGDGADTFVFEAGDGRDVIADFDTSEDLIDLSAMATSMGDVELSQAGKSVKVEVGDVTVYLQHTDLADVTDDVFVLGEAEDIFLG